MCFMEDRTILLHITNTLHFFILFLSTFLHFLFHYSLKTKRSYLLCRSTLYRAVLCAWYPISSSVVCKLHLPSDSNAFAQLNKGWTITHIPIHHHHHPLTAVIFAILCSHSPFQGLSDVAIIRVARFNLCQAQFSAIGFVCVDMFFTTSVYLMTCNLLRDLTRHPSAPAVTTTSVYGDFTSFVLFVLSRPPSSRC